MAPALCLLPGVRPSETVDIWNPAGALRFNDVARERGVLLCYSLIRLLHAHARRPPCPAAFPVRGAFHSRAIHAALSVSACSCCSMSARRQRIDRPPTLMGLGNLLSRVQRQIVAAETAKRCATCSTVSHSLPFAYAIFCPALCFVAEHYRGGTLDPSSGHKNYFSFL